MGTMGRWGAMVAGLLGLAGPALAATGTGPGGYTWKDCQEPDGPACSNVGMAVSDGNTGLCSEEIYDPPGGIGFQFPFYGTNRTNFHVSANGVVYFVSPPLVDDNNSALTGNEGRPFVSVLWDDWAMDNDDILDFLCNDPGCSNTGPFTAVESYQIGSGADANGPFKDFGWFSTAHHRPTCTEDFGEQASFWMRLHADGRILFQYEDTVLGLPGVTDHGASATIGISAGSLGRFTQVSFNTASIPSNPYAILFLPPCSPLACTGIRVSPDPACEGDTVTLTSDHSGGQSPVLVEWDFDGDTIIDDDGPSVSTTFTPGIWTVTTSVSDDCADPDAQRCGAAVNVTVNRLPKPAVTPMGATSFCAADGDFVVLDAGLPGTYQWHRNGADLVGEVFRTHTTALSGSYTVTVTDDVTLCSATSPPLVVDATDCTIGCTALSCTSVTVSPDPACEGELQTFTALFGGGEGAVTVDWDTDGDTAADDGSGNPLRTVMPVGTATVTAHLADTCVNGTQECSVSTQTTVGATPAPVVTANGPLQFCATAGENVTLDAGAGWASHQWMRGGSPLGGQTARTLLVTSGGFYTVIVWDALDCRGESATVVVDSQDCTAACTPLDCNSIIVLPTDEPCEDQQLDLLVIPTGGEGGLTIAWDLDGDTQADDAVGPSTQHVFPVGSNVVTAVVTDLCANPDPQTCSASLPLTVAPGASALAEVSGPGDAPLLVNLAFITVDALPAATAYNVHVDRIGSWYAPSPANGSTCGITSWTDNGDGTISFGPPIPLDSWLVVTASNACAEGPVGTDSLGRDRRLTGTWTGCGPSP